MGGGVNLGPEKMFSETKSDFFEVLSFPGDKY